MIGLRRSILQFTSSFLIFALVFSAVLISFPSSSKAKVSVGPGRIRACHAQGNTEGLVRFTFGQDSPDLLFVFSNPVCLAIAVGSYAAVKVAIGIMNSNCGTGSGVRILPSPFLDVIDIVHSTAKGIADNNASCLVAVGAANVMLLQWIAWLQLVYDIAESANDQVRLCGANWMGPHPESYTFASPAYKQTVEDEYNRLFIENPERLTLGEGGSKQYREWYFNGQEVQDNPDEGISDIYSHAGNTMAEGFTSMGSGLRTAAEETASGVMKANEEMASFFSQSRVSLGDARTSHDIKTRYVDRGAVCRDPTRPIDPNTGLYPVQRYYMRGTHKGNFNCDKYKVYLNQTDPLTGTLFTEARQQEMINAYECCVRRSTQYVCLESSRETKFCRGGKQCGLMISHNNANISVLYSTEYRDNDRLICVKSYSLCPFNHTVALGTNTCEYYKDGIWDDESGTWRMISAKQIEDGECKQNSEIRNDDCSFNQKAGKCRNYCQYLTHCVKTGFHIEDQRGQMGPYFSSACIDFIGDSQNKASYGGTLLGGYQKHFSAPLAQCVKETLENLFLNRVGHSECRNNFEYPSGDGICPSGEYSSRLGFEFKMGNKAYANSFFEKLQDYMRLAIKVGLGFAVMVFGFGILSMKINVGDKKQILTFVIKLAVVMYFSLGTAWQDVFFEGIYNVSSEFSRMVFKVAADPNPMKRDGCQFIDYELVDGTYVSSGFNYPKGKRYLALWDTLDCKIMRYLGFGPEASVANLVMLIIAAFFTGAVGIYVALSVMAFGLFMLAATIRALHIFLSSCIAIILMVFISPIIFPLMLFEKTKDIFDKWLQNLISFSLQPMILFAYIAIFVTVMDKAFIGSATFVGNPPMKAMSCSVYCTDENGVRVDVDPDTGEAYACNKKGDVWVDPMRDSLACIVGYNKFGKFPGLEIIGIGIPFLWDFLMSDTKEKIILILRCALIMYLLYRFMDEIPGITTDLIGGKTLGSGTFDQDDIIGGAIKGGVGFIERARNTSRSAGEGIKDEIKKRLPKDSDDKDKDAKAEGSDHAASSGDSKEGDKKEGGDGSDNKDSASKDDKKDGGDANV